MQEWLQCTVYSTDVNGRAEVGFVQEFGGAAHFLRWCCDDTGCNSKRGDNDRAEIEGDSSAKGNR